MSEPRSPFSAPRRRGLALSGALAAAACALAAAASARPQPPAQEERPVRLSELAEMAEREGLRGRVHGANPRQGTYVFTWARPGRFFDSVNLSLLPANDAIRQQLAVLERHQEARVKGRLELEYGSQPHLLVQELEPGEKWSPGVVAKPPSPPVDLRKALAGQVELTALVHALAEDGGMLVVEWRDAVIPVQVPEIAALRKQVGALYRGDRVRLRFRVAPHPREPLHLALDVAGERPPLEVLDSMHDQHGRERTIEGRLVLFPKSPVLRRSIYAVEEAGPDGLHRYFTVFNFDDLKDQDRTDARLAAAWKAGPGEVLDARNKYIHEGVRIRVSGKVNNPAQNQANPALATTSERVEVVR